MIAPNIFRFSPESLLAWTAAYAMYEPLTYFAIPAVLRAPTVQEYYNYKKTPFAVVAFGDFIYSTFLFLVAQQVITGFFGAAAPTTWMNWLSRFATFVGVQWIGDLSFYGIVSSLPPVSRYIRFFQRYGADVGVGAPIGDSIYGLFWFLLTQAVARWFPAWLQVALIVLFSFGTLVVSY